MKHMILRRMFSAVVMAVLAIGLCVSQGTTITLVHVNDTHSHLDAYGPKDHALKGTIGGIAKAATIIGAVRATEPNVLVLHAGDAFVGDFFFNKYFGVPELQMLQQIGVDAMTVGNHEFEFGPEALTGILMESFPSGHFPILSANLDMSAFPPLSSWVLPATMRTVDGIHVGIFGLTVPGNPTTNSAPVRILENIAEIAYRMQDSLRAEGAQVVVLLSHLGMYLDRIIASNIPGIDVIIGGHDHLTFIQPERVVNPAGTTTVICQAGAMYQNVGKLTLNVSGTTVSMTGYQMLAVDAAVPAEPALQAVVDQLKGGIVAHYGDVYGTVVARAPRDLDETYDARSPFRDTPLGNIVTDAYRWKTNTTISVTALGLIAEKIYAGPIVGADVFHAVSYGYDPATGLGLQLATGTITGSELIKGLEMGLSQLEITDDFCLQVAGMSFIYDSRKPVGERVLLSSVRIDGQPISPNTAYALTTNTGIIAVLGGMGVTVENIQILPDFEYTVLKDYLQSLRVVRTFPEGRIIDVSVKPWAALYDAGHGFIGRLMRNHCWPNPFNPATNIVFELPEAGRVSLKVFNMLGQEVAVLANEELPAGIHQRMFDASRLASGAYFYRIEALGQVETAKIILMK